MTDEKLVLKDKIDLERKNLEITKFEMKKAMSTYKSLQVKKREYLTKIRSLNSEYKKLSASKSTSIATIDD